jgi:phosphatidylinositol glycan class M
MGSLFERPLFLEQTYFYFGFSWNLHWTDILLLKQMYGYEFLYETYLYHFERKDHRHNFSIYFYTIYQLFDEPASSTLAILTFLPQWGIVILAGIFLYYDLFLALFVQTTAFVMFNKVITAQYFLWYVTLVPMVLVNSSLTKQHFWIGYIMIIMFVILDVSWCT